LAGVFIAYFRDDQRLARRVRNALVSLGVDVIWDEEMPGGVPWRQWIADNIDSLAAVVVLWTPGSITRPNVHEEAMEGVKGRKLISVMHGIDQPPLGYAKDNISRLDSWEAGKPDSGWKSFVAEIDSKIATSSGQRPGSLIAIYNSQLDEVRARKAELAAAEREGKQRLAQRTKLERACEKAAKQVERDEQSLEAVQGAQMAPRPKMAALNAANEELENAREQHGAALQRLDEFDDSSEQADVELEHKRKNLDEYLVFIGGSGEGSGSYVPPPPPPPGESRAEPPPVESQEPGRTLPPVGPRYMPQDSQQDCEPDEVKVGDDAPEEPEPPVDVTPVQPATTKSPATLFGFLEPSRNVEQARARRRGLVIGVFLVLGLALWIFASRQVVESESGESLAVNEAKPDVPQVEPKPSLTFAEDRRQKLAWLLVPKWGGVDGCNSAPNMYLSFDLTKSGVMLEMGVNGRKESDQIEEIGRGESVTTASQIISKVAPNRITAVNRKGGTSTEFEKCAR
jgi:TIR domain